MADKDSLQMICLAFWACADLLCWKIDTYKSGRGVPWPKLNFAEEYLAGLLPDIKANCKRE